MFSHVFIIPTISHSGFLHTKELWHPHVFHEQILIPTFPAIFIYTLIYLHMLHHWQMTFLDYTPGHWGHRGFFLADLKMPFHLLVSSIGGHSYCCLPTYAGSFSFECCQDFVFIFAPSARGRILHTLRALLCPRVSYDPNVSRLIRTSFTVSKFLLLSFPPHLSLPPALLLSYQFQSDVLSQYPKEHLFAFSVAVSNVNKLLYLTLI